MNELIITKLNMLLHDFGPVANDESASHIVKEAIEALRLIPASALTREPVTWRWKINGFRNWNTEQRWDAIEKVAKNEMDERGWITELLYGAAPITERKLKDSQP